MACLLAVENQPAFARNYLRCCCLDYHGALRVSLIFFGRHYAILGWFGVPMSLGTVFTTSMICSQLATVPRWNTPLTSVLYLTIAITGIALLVGKTRIALSLLLFTGAVQTIRWARGDNTFIARGSDIGTEYCLGEGGKVYSMAHPHSSPNYLTRQFIYVVGRKYAQKLSVISLILMAVLPAV